MLTYMSIKDVALDQVAQGNLIPVRPRSRRAVIRRAMFVYAPLWEELGRDDADGISLERKANLRADLDVFVSSETLDPKYLFWLSPVRDLVWEIRSCRDDPSIRIVGLFADKDVFVATNFQRRDALGGWNSEEWKLAKRNALAHWRALFFTYLPHGSKGATIDDFFTGALSARYFK